ncbi:MAG: hypothetical protein IT306_29510 [Chloroflexi bacterium]|nr:hypothetical protein [Chloroflexota bacterium]
MRSEPSLPGSGRVPVPSHSSVGGSGMDLSGDTSDIADTADQPGSAASTASLDQFSATSQRVLSAAREQARQLRHREIQPEHLLVALLLDQSSAVTRPMLRVVGSSRGELADLRERLLQQLRGIPPTDTDSPALSERCKHVLELALAGALQLSRPSRAGVEPVHLLVGLVSEGSALRDTALATKLALRGLRMSVGTSAWLQPPTSPGGPMLHQVQAGRRPPTESPGESATRDNVITLRVTDADLAAVDALVEVGAMRTRSEASAWLVQSGIVANQPFFDQIRSIHEEIARLRQEAQHLADEHLRRLQPSATESGVER